MKKKVKVQKAPKGKRKNIIKEIFCVNNKFNFKGLLKNILMSVGGGLLVGFITRNSINVYDTLKKSLLTPSNSIFQIVWIVLYTLIGIAAYRIYMNNKSEKNDYNGYFYYLVQLLINFLWPIIFFNLRLYGISFILIIILLILIIITTIKFFKVDTIAGVLMIPYIGWVAFASYLTFYIWMFNEM
ncbi:MAG: TspO/MBR family protein [Clostridium celatum]|nr:tryptophan-rich sensory protein [Clostridium celatum]MDU2122478.1 TspO/MBR family protein [Clostridium celatum]MDU4979431.1 TspO/MBR family protein [Clostridium celatum]